MILKSRDLLDIVCMMTSCQSISFPLVESISIPSSILLVEFHFKGLQCAPEHYLQLWQWCGYLCADEAAGTMQWWHYSGQDHWDAHIVVFTLVLKPDHTICFPKVEVHSWSICLCIHDIILKAGMGSWRSVLLLWLVHLHTPQLWSNKHCRRNVR